MITFEQLMFELKYGKEMRIHMSPKPFKLERRTFTQPVDIKPKGFWYGFGNEWIDWVRSEMPDWEGKYIYKVDIGSSNILKIESHMELMQFHRTYLVDKKKLTDNSMIKWSDVAKKYDGIEINPYQWEARNQYIWYYAWDVASGCIWNLENVKLTLLTDLRWSAVLLDEKSRTKLIDQYKSQIPNGWDVIAHHQTIDPFNLVSDALVGKPVELKVIAVGLSDKAFAVKVEGYQGKTNNKFPHVTIAINRAGGAKPKDSNEIKNWTPVLNGITLKGTIENL